MKKRIISLIFLFMILLCGCGDKHLTAVLFGSYAECENPVGYSTGDEYVFEINKKKYEVMKGYSAEQNAIINHDKGNKYKLLLVDSNKKVYLTVITEDEYETFEKENRMLEGGYEIKAIRECTDTDGKVYIMYSRWDTDIGNLFIEELKSTHILEIDMINYTVTQEYDFGESIVVLTVHDGYVYTMEDGRVYRALLGQTDNKECMADLGFRGMPDVEQFAGLTFRTEADGIKIIAAVKDEEKGYGYKSYELAYVKYTDSPCSVVNKIDTILNRFFIGSSIYAY